MILMLAPRGEMVFGAMPSGSTYVANQYGVIVITNGSAADQVALQNAGCLTLLGAFVGGLPGQVTLLTTTGNLLVPGAVYGVKSSEGALSMTLPPLSSVSGNAMIEIQDIDFEAATNNQTIVASGTDKIVYQDMAPASTFTMNENGICLRFIAAGTYWRVIYYGG